MKQKTLKIALTCFIGGVLGTFIGPRHSILGLTLSIVSGAILGYVLYNLRAVFTAIPIAFRDTSMRVKRWKGVPEVILKVQLWGLAAGICLLTTLLLFILLALVPFPPQPHETPTPIFVLVFTFIMGSVIFGQMIISNSNTVQNNALFNIISQEKGVKNAQWVLIYLNPIVFPFTMLHYIVKAMEVTVTWICCTALPWVLNFFWNFIKKLFFLIHSEVRLICMTDSAIGAGIGYTYNSPLLGGLVGALFGALNYWIVSIKILKLKPKF